VSDDLPEGWAERRLGALVQPSKEKSEPDSTDRRPYVGLEHIESNTNRIIGQAKAAEAKSTTSVFRRGDVLFSKLRPYLNKVAIAPFDGVGSTEIIVFPQLPHLSNRFLVHFLSRQETVSTAQERSAGVQLPRITFERISDLNVPLPPLAEQRRIVAKVESLLDEVNRAKARLDRVPVILKRFRQAVLAAACSGELTPSSDADAWKTTQIGSVAGFITSGSRGWAAYYSDAGPLFIRAQNLNSDQLILDDVAHVTPPKNSETARTRVQKNDVLVTITGANVTKSGLVTDDLGDAYVSQHVGLIRPLDGRISRWLYTWLLSPAHGRKQLLDFAYGAGKPGLNLDNLRNVEISLPPLDEQAEIVRQVDALFALADAIERRVAVATARAEKLPQAILAKAFAGELVPTEAELARAEGRDYETAAALLARVARDAATAAPAAAPKRRGRPPKSAR
jgi:type I restriction enzyme S subunit